MHYTAFGLTFESQIDLPELHPIPPTPPDVTIVQGEVPTEIDPVLGDGVLYQINQTQFRLEVPNVGRYFVENGKRIVFQPEEDTDDQSIRLFLLGSSLAAIFHQRGLLPLHASAVRTPHGAAIFCGVSGVGKSTLAAALNRRGHAIISDDISVIAETDTGCEVLPGYPQQKLWANILEQMDIAVDNLERVRPHFEKYSVPLTENAASEAVPIHRVYILGTANNLDEPTLTPIEGLAKLRPLANHTYRRQYLVQMEKGERHSPLLMKLTATTPLRRIVRPDDLDMLDMLVDMLEEDINA